MKTILITGGAGFIGSNFVCYFLKNYDHYNIINLDNLTYAGDRKNLQAVENHPRHQFIKGDICDQNLLKNIFAEHKIQGVIHFAAESHVDNSIKKPDMFVKTNFLGTFYLLEACRNSWMESPFSAEKPYENARFHHISTDEVYGSLGATGLFCEETPYAPNSPYSATKAGSDFLVRAYNKTYGLNVTTSNCSNNYGPKQHAEKLIPVVIKKAINHQKIPVYGDGKNIRDWLFVEDHCEAIDIIFHKGKSGETYNVGGNNEQKNIDLVKQILEVLNKKGLLKTNPLEDLIEFVEDRSGHDRRYAIDASKIQKELQWTPKTTFKTGIEKTIDWYIKTIL